MRFASLGSGSSGNGTVIEAQEGSKKTRVLLDCGFSTKELTRRLARLDLTDEDIDAVVITHEHADHIGSTFSFVRRYKKPLLMSWGTAQATQAHLLAVKHGIDLRILQSNIHYEFQALKLHPFTVPHDAREPLQFIFSDGASRLGILTDVGVVTKAIENVLSDCQAMIVECNHDTEMLARGCYPAKLKARVAGNFGHLANADAAILLTKLHHAQLRHVVAAHLSSENNTKMLAQLALSTALGTKAVDILTADQEHGVDWLSLR